MNRQFAIVILLLLLLVSCKAKTAEVKVEEVKETNVPSIEKVLVDPFGDQ